MNFRESPDFVKYQLPVLIWMGFIFALSCVPGSTLAPIEFMDAHLIAHSLLFGMLYILGYRALKYQNYSRFLHEFSLLAALVLVALYGASDEFHQSFTPGRTEDFKDLMIDVMAGLVALLIVMAYERIRNTTKKLEEN